PALISLVWHLITGEALPPEACRRWLRLYPRIPLLNAYGPTECSDDVTQHVVAAPPAPDVRHLPIGRALDNLRVYVLDPALQPLPVGIPGQLYIGGVGGGRGYQGDPRRTAEAFLPDPFSPRPGARLYRTGDLVRYVTDGTLEFLDRIGQQVKLRGFRIELGEIESALRAHPRIREAAVLAREDVPGDRRLVGYVAPAGGADLDVEELRAFVARSLPDYMVPAAFVILEALPLTSNGKLDRKALPAPAAGRSAPHGPQLVPPRDRVESELVDIWQEVLATRPIGVHDNFFALGGHSLLAVRLMGMIHKRFDQELPLALLVEAGTIEQLAAALRGAAAEPAAWAPLVALQPEGEGPPFFCIHPIGGQVLCYVDLSRHLGAGQRFYGLQAPRLDEVGAAAPAIEEMAAAYLEAVREVQPEGPYLLGGWSMGGILAFEMARQLHARGEEAALVAILDAWSPAVHRVVPDDAYLLYEIVKDQSLQKGMAPPVSYEELRALQPEECLRRVLEEGRRAGLVAEDVGVSWLRRFLQGYRARREALQRYRPSPYPGRLTLLRAAEEDAGFLRTLQTELGIDVEDPTLGWSALSGKPVAIQIVDGNHSTMCAGDNARVLAGRLRTAIAAAVRDSAAPPELRSAGSRSVLFHDASPT
ncbi:MAG TPA: thioesterase domain-containing protein, partial [Thermoanaerobaculia bacterium]|nr:thioesterase domain-containing protein [Thermoanaerobaculia bacterium]